MSKNSELTPRQLQILQVAARHLKPKTTYGLMTSIARELELHTAYVAATLWEVASKLGSSGSEIRDVRLTIQRARERGVIE